MTDIISRIKSGESFAIITDGAPKERVVANVSLARLVQASPLLRDAHQVEGFYEGKSDGISYVIFGISPALARGVGMGYGQETVVTPLGLEYCTAEGGPMATWTGRVLTGAEAEASGFFSRPVGGGEAFSLELTWPEA